MAHAECTSLLESFAYLRLATLKPDWLTMVCSSDTAFCYIDTRRSDLAYIRFRTPLVNTCELMLARVKYFYRKDVAFSDDMRSQLVFNFLQAIKILVEAHPKPLQQADLLIKELPLWDKWELVLTSIVLDKPFSGDLVMQFFEYWSDFTQLSQPSYWLWCFIARAASRWSAFIPSMNVLLDSLWRVEPFRFEDGVDVLTPFQTSTTIPEAFPTIPDIEETTPTDAPKLTSSKAQRRRLRSQKNLKKRENATLVCKTMACAK